MPVLRHHGLALQRRRRDRALSGDAAAPRRSTGFELKAGKLPRTAVKALLARPRHRAARARALPRRDRRDGARLSPRSIDAQARVARERQSLADRRAHCSRRRGKPAADFDELIAAKERELDPGVRQAARAMAEDPRAATRRTSTW